MSPPDRANRGRGSWCQRGSVRVQSTTSRLSISRLKYRLYMRFGLYASYLVGNAPIPASILLGRFGGTDHLLGSRGLTTSTGSGSPRVKQRSTSAGHERRGEDTWLAGYAPVREGFSYAGGRGAARGVSRCRRPRRRLGSVVPIELGRSRRASEARSIVWESAGLAGETILR